MPYKRNRPQTVLAALVSVGLLVPRMCAEGKPLSLGAAQHALTLENLAKKAPSERSLSEDELQRFLEFTETDNADLELIGVLALAYASDDGSASRLRTMEAEEEGLLSGAASYALMSRKLAGKGPNEQLLLLREGLKTATNSYTRLFVANRIAVDFGEPGIPAIVEAMKVERDEMVKCDMLYYLATAAALPKAKAILDLQWNKAAGLPESLAYIMGSLTPGRSKDAEKNSVGVLLLELKAKHVDSSEKEGGSP